MAKIEKDKSVKEKTSCRAKDASVKKERASEVKESDKVRRKFTLKVGISSGQKFKLSDAKYKPATEVKKMAKNKNALSKHFDANNGDFDTPEEFLRAYFKGDESALKSLSVKHIGYLKDALDEFFPELKGTHLDGIESPTEMREYLEKMIRDRKFNLTV